MDIKFFESYDKRGRQEVKVFLEKFDLQFEATCDYSVAFYEDTQIIATASKEGNILKCFAVNPALQGEGMTNQLLSHLINRCSEEGNFHYFLFTRLCNISIFQACHFSVIAKTDTVALLEGGIGDITSCIEKIIDENSIEKIETSAVIVNCNPFTLGHYFLIEKASRASKQVVVFVVEAEKSLFPFSIRLALVKEGVKDLKNVIVVPGTEYIISQATFPNYFLRENDDKLSLFTELDVTLFCEHFVKKLTISKRFIGSEPYCATTRAYNEMIKKIMAKYGVEVIEVERIENHGAISASRVREAIKQDSDTELQSLLPKSSYEFLKTEDGQKIVETIKKSHSRH